MDFNDMRRESSKIILERGSYALIEKRENIWSYNEKLLNLYFYKR